MQMTRWSVCPVYSWQLFRRPIRNLFPHGSILRIKIYLKVLLENVTTVYDADEAYCKGSI